MTLNQVVESTLKNSNMNYKMLKNSKNSNSTNFMVECKTVKIYGAVTNEKYKWQIKKNDNTIIDESECSIKNTDDVINRIYETINTSNKLSKYVEACNTARKEYLKPGFITEDDEEDKEDKRQLLLSDEDVVDGEPIDDEFDVQTALDNIIQRSVELATDLIGVIDALPDNDIENKEDLIGLAGNFYGMADDIDDVIDELYPEDDLEEGCKKTKKRKTLTDNKKIINKISEASILMRNNPNYKEIREALKLIKSELVLRK